MTLCNPMDGITPAFPVHHQLPELPQTHVHWVGDAIQPSHPLSSPSPPTFSLSQHQVFSNESALCIRWQKYWSFSFNISPSNEYSELISFRMDRMDLLAVQGTLKSLLQHHSSKASVLQGLDFLMSQLRCLSSIFSSLFSQVTWQHWAASWMAPAAFIYCSQLGPALQTLTVPPQRKSPWHFLHHKSLSFFSYFFFFLSLFILSPSLRFQRVFISKLHIHIFESLKLESSYVWDLLYWIYPWNKN